MADRIMAALDYLDAHTSIVLQKNKHRSLGDINAKYDVVDPTEYGAVTQDHVALSGTRGTNLSRGRTAEEILEEDRVRIVKSAHSRTRSVPNSKLPSRPMTSSSFAGTFPAQRHGSTQTSVKRLAFTAPGVSVGPSNVRDDVMEDKVIKIKNAANKNKRTQDRARTANSAPTYGRGYLSIGCRSLSSNKRPKTYHVGSARSNTSSRWQRKPGPFAKVKVGASDMWVVSESTPTSYFDGDVINTNNSSKLPKWEEQADSVPREEKKSPPRFERQLGAPPQFGNEGQWYTFSGRDPTKYRPVLTAFTDKNDSDWYNIESRISGKVANQVEASPGIRIGRNGNVVSNSMKVKSNSSGKKGEDSGLSESEDEFTESEKSEAGSDVGNGESNIDTDVDVDSISSGDPDKDVTTSGDSPDPREEEDKMFSLLRFLGVSGADNPYVTESLSSAKSSSDVSIFTSIYGKQGLVKSDDKDDEQIWKALEGASPHLWVSRDKWSELRMNIARRKIKAKLALQNAEASAPPLSWQDQVAHGNAKVLDSTLRTDSENVKNKNTSLPVVFRKLLNCDQLPSGFLHMTSSGYRSHSSVAHVDKEINVTSPSKGHDFEITHPQRSVKSAHLTRDSNEPAFQPRPYTSDVRSRDVISTLPNRSIELGSFLRATETLNLAKNKKEETTDRDDVTDVELEAMRVEAAINMKMMGDVTEGEPPKVERKQSLQKSETSLKKIQNGVTLNSLPVKSDTTISTVDIHSNERRQPAQVTSLNLRELEKDYSVVNGTRTTFSPTSPTRESLLTPPNSVSNVPRFSLNLKSPVLTSHPEGPEAPDSGDRNKRRVVTRSASIVNRSPVHSSRSQPIQLNNDTSPPRSSRPSGGFTASPLTGRPSHAKQTTRFGGISKPVRVISDATINCDPELGFSSPGDGARGTPSGFIQIAHSLHIPTTFKSKKSPAGGARSKMIDSYMHELSARDDVVKTREASGIVGKSLGGTSGRTIPGSWTPSPKKSGVHNPQSFSIHGGRKSGLAIATDQSANRPIRGLDRDPRDLLNLQGGQVRLNLDKNIHVIYRDLGIPKKSRIGSMPGSPVSSKTMNFDDVTKKRSTSASRRSDGTRSNPMSAKSRPATGHRSVASERSVVVTIPTVSTSQSEVEREVTSESIRLSDVFKNDVTAATSDHVTHGRRATSQDGVDSPNNIAVEASLDLGHDVITTIGNHGDDRDVSGLERATVKQGVTDSGTQYSPHRDAAPEQDRIEHDISGDVAIDDVTAENDADGIQSEPKRNDPAGEVKQISPEIIKGNDVITDKTISQNVDETENNDVTDKIDSVIRENDDVTRQSENVTRENDDLTRQNNDVIDQNNEGSKKNSDIIPQNDDVVQNKNDVENESIQVDDVIKHKALRQNRRSVSESQIKENGYHSEKDDVTDDEVTVRGITKVTVNITSLTDSN